MMSSGKAKNRKRRASFWGKPAPSRRMETARDLREKEYRLSAEIDSLEDLLAELESKRESREDMRRNNILPPPEPSPRSPYWQPQIRAGHRPVEPKRRHPHEGFLQFLILLAIASALAFWLFYTGG